MKLYFSIIFALFSLFIGYDYGGSIFMLFISPYLAYMVFKCKAIYYPALVLHCASGTSVTIFTFVCILILSITRYRVVLKLKLKYLFVALLSILPIFIYLVWMNIAQLKMYIPLAFSDIGYYLSFFSFFFGVLISSSFSEKILRALSISLIFIFCLNWFNLTEFVRITLAFTFFFSAYFAIYFSFKSTEKIFLPISILGILSALFLNEESTLTNIFVSLGSFLLTFLYFKNKKSIILSLTGVAPFLIILFLYFIGINYYLSETEVQIPELKGFTNLSQWITYKFYADRAPFWAGGISQILIYVPFWPIPGIPDIDVISLDGNLINVPFGSHTTLIELVRKFGIVAGLILNISLIFIVLLSRKIFLLNKLPYFFIPFFSMAIVTTIILTLTGSFQIMPEYALLSLGVLGIAYGKYYHITSHSNN
jgi:hypothetical protein